MARIALPSRQVVMNSDEGPSFAVLHTIGVLIAAVIVTFSYWRFGENGREAQKHIHDAIAMERAARGR